MKIFKPSLLFQVEDCGVRERHRGQDGQDRAAAAEPGGQGRGGQAAATGEEAIGSSTVRGDHGGFALLYLLLTL